MGVSCRYFQCSAVEGFVSGDNGAVGAGRADAQPGLGSGDQVPDGRMAHRRAFVLKFDDVAPALWSYLVIGTLVAAAASPGIAGRVGRQVATAA